MISEQRAFWRWWVVASLVPALLAGGLLAFTRFATPQLRLRQAHEELGELQRCLEAFHAYHHRWPRAQTSTEFLHALMGRIDAVGKKTEVLWFVGGRRFNFRAANPDAVDAAILDPWGRPYHYVYRAPANGVAEGYLLFSAGPDGKCSDWRTWDADVHGKTPVDADNISVSSVIRAK